MKSGGAKNKKILSLLLIGAYLILNIWMFQDIMHRETIVSKNANVLVMGTNATFKPFEYKDGDKVVGFDVDLAEEIAKSLGAELKIEKVVKLILRWLECLSLRIVPKTPSFLIPIMLLLSKLYCDPIVVFVINMN